MHKMIDGKRVELTAAEEREIRAKWAAEEARLARSRYKEKRRMEYPDMGDQLDAILKQLNYLQMSGKLDLISDLDTVVSKWLKVKRENPKPE